MTKNVLDPLLGNGKVLSVDGEKGSPTKAGGRYRLINAGASLAPLAGCKSLCALLIARYVPLPEHAVQRSNYGRTRSLITGR